VIVPSGPTRRTRWLTLSAMTNPPPRSTATSVGEFRRARLAGPPSPAKPQAPVPATVVITPAAVNWRTRRLLTSARRKP
jgi:hypothetical protein